MTKLTAEKRNDIDDARFAFAKQRKEPIENASHVRNAIARFDQVEGVTDAERDSAWKRIVAAAKKFRVEVSERLVARARKDGPMSQAGVVRRAAQ